MSEKKPSFWALLFCGVGVHWNVTQWYDVRTRRFVTQCKDCHEVLGNAKDKEAVDKWPD